MKRLALLCLLAFTCGSLYAAATVKVPTVADNILTIQDGVDAAGDGGTVIISKNPNSSDGAWYENVTVTGYNSLTITGKVIWDGNVGGTPDSCLTITGSPTTNGPFLISGIIFRNATQAVSANSGSGNEVHGVTITGCQGLFTQNEFSLVRGDNFVATKNTLLGCNDGFAVTGNSATISGNKFTQCANEGVNITGTGAAGTQKALLEKNSFFLHDGGQLIAGTSSNVTVISTSAKTSVGGIQLTGDNCLVTATSYSHVTGGISITEATATGNNQAVKNKFSSTDGAAIFVRGPNAVVMSNSISVCTGTAIQTDNSSPDIQSNSIKVANRGIQCGSANNALVDKNKIATTFNNDGINVSGNNLTITNNSITGISNGDGIQLSDGGTGGALVDKNKLKNIGDHGITSSCDGSSATVLISNCSVAFAGANNQNGINVTGRGTQVNKCKVSNIDGDGIRVNADNCKVTDCSATKCGIDGFDCDGTSDGNTFLRCKASACGGEGFDNSNSTNTNVTDSSFTKSRINLASENVGAGFIVITNTTPSAVEGAPEVD